MRLLAFTLILVGLVLPVRAVGNRPARGDVLGDPLPPGAILRLGTERLRHSFDVASVAFSPDGTRLATGSRDRTVGIWDAATGKLLKKLDHGSEILCVVFTPDGKHVASAGNADRTVRLWEVEGGQQVRRFEGHTNLIHAIAVSPDGKLLASTGWDGTVRLWDLGSGRETLKLPVGRSLFCVAFSPDGKILAAAGSARRGPRSPECSIFLWEVPTGKPLRTLNGQGGQVYALAFAHDGKVLASAGGHPDHAIHLWDHATGQEAARLPGNPQDIRCLSWSRDGKMLASADHTETKIWDVAGGTEMQTLAHLGRCCAFSPDGKTLAAAGRHFTVHLRDLTAGKDRLALCRHEGPVAGLAVNADGKRLVTNDGHTLRIWEAATGKLVREIKGGGDIVQVFALSPDGRTLVTAPLDRTVHFFDAATGNELHRHKVADYIRFLAFAPDGKTVALAGGQIRLWDAHTGRELGVIAQPAERVAFSPGGKLLASGTNPQPHRGAPTGQVPGSLCLWDLATGKARFKLTEKGGKVRFSPDGHVLLTSDDRNLHGWEVATGKHLFKLPVGSQGLSLFEMAPDGRLVATACYTQPMRGPNPIQLWDVATRQPFGALPGHSETIQALAFAPDGRALISGSADSTALVWDLAGLKARLELPTNDLTAAKLDALWSDLGGADAEVADLAFWRLAAGRGKTVAYVSGKLKPAAGIDGDRITRLIAQLDDGKFAVRSSAANALRELGPVARPYLEAALKGEVSLEVKSRVGTLLEELQGVPLAAGALRATRAVRLLEAVGSDEARHVLEALAKGDPGATLTTEAGAALGRLTKKR
jgi:WD40 repeat protein